MEKMQEFIDFIFHEVWCKAPNNGPFDLDLFDASPDLKEVMTAFYYGHTEPGDFFLGCVEGIYREFAKLTPPEIDQFRHWYGDNNEIEKACANDPGLHLARYDDIEPLHEELSKKIADLFKRLYWDRLLDLAALRQKIGDIGDHYMSFMGTNTIGKCPFCGIGDVKGVYHTKKEAYDHYLPKGQYPFNSINFRNLAPACHECNSSYKLGKDPVKTATGRRRAFYPYANPGHSIDIKIDLKKADVEHLSPDNIEIQYGPAELNEEIETWKDVYSIDERYRAKCCGENDGKYWLAQVLDEWQEDGHSPVDFMKILSRQTAKSPFAESNFLKKAFLEGCNRAGLF
jgi:hypothetical protein